MPINIHGKQYITVAERVQEAGDSFISLSTEVLFQEPVVIKATVTTKKGSFTGISAANPSKQIEKVSPYEVAETSAVGRALGFAGYGIVEGIASADEIVKAESVSQTKAPSTPSDKRLWCDYHKCEMRLNKNGNPYHRMGEEFCNGMGFPSEREAYKNKVYQKKDEEIDSLVASMN